LCAILMSPCVLHVPTYRQQWGMQNRVWSVCKMYNPCHSMGLNSWLLVVHYVLSYLRLRLLISVTIQLSQLLPRVCTPLTIIATVSNLFIQDAFYSAFCVSFSLSGTTLYFESHPETALDVSDHRPSMSGT